MAKKRTNQKKKNDKSNHSKQIKAIVIMAVAIFLLALVVIPVKSLGSAGVVIKDVIFGIFGFCSYFIPFVLGYIAVILAFEKTKSNKATVIFASLFALFLDTSFEVFGHSIENLNFFKYLGESFTLNNADFGGGIFGGILAYPLTYFLGEPLSRITIILLIVVTLMITTGTTLQRVGVFAKKTGEKAQQIHNETKEWIEKRADNKEEEKAKSNKKFNVDVSLDGMPERPKVIDELYKEKEKTLEKKADISVKEPTPTPVKEKPVVKKQRAVKQPVESEPVRSKSGDYIFPPLDLLPETKNADTSLVEAELKSNSDLLVNVLRSFGVEVRVTGFSRGPSVTRYEIQPAVGVRISKITGLADDIALQLRASSIRISPIPNKSSIGIEVPNTNFATVGMRELISSPDFTKSKSKLLVSLGKDVTGASAYCDLSKMPHLLVAGTTGSGKSVCLNTMIMSILYRATPDEVKFVMIDPKAVEFPVYNGIPHLLVPVVTDSRKAAGALGWAVVEMEKRYKMLAENGVRNIGGYNELAKKTGDFEPLSHIVIFIDEFADLMMVAGNEVESSVCRIAQKARAAGIHLVIATQRPSANIFTGLIKSNIPSRIALAVAGRVDSQIIIDMQGAEKLLGKGDMLYKPVGVTKPLRVQGSFISDEVVKNVIEFVKEHSDENEYDQSVICEIDRQAAEEDSPKSSGTDDDFGSYDAKINEAIEVVVESGMASTSLLQRKLSLGYARAARIVDQMEEKGIVGPHRGSKPREVLITRQDWQQMQMQQGIPVNSAVKQPSPTQLSFDDEEALNDDTDTADEYESVDFVEADEQTAFIDDDEPTVHLDKDDDEDLDYIDEDFLNNI